MLALTLLATPALRLDAWSRSTLRRCAGGTAPPVRLTATADAADVQRQPSRFPQWPVYEGKKEIADVLASFPAAATSVPPSASSDPGDGWRVWRDAGYGAHKFVQTKLSRDTYPATVVCLRAVLVESLRRYPDLFAVLKFVPKKNGLNPMLALMEDAGAGPSLDGLKPREVKRQMEDLSRSLEQTWLLLACYLTLPNDELRDDMLWSARTVVEKVKTDQRSRALELLCLGFYERDASLFELIDPSAAHVAFRADGDSVVLRGRMLRADFDRNFGVERWHPKPTNARMVWQRCRMVYPFLEMAYRAWLDSAGLSAEHGALIGEDAIASLLDRIARAGPEEKVINSLLYILIDLGYRVMLAGEEVPRWAPEPYILRRDGVEERMLDEFSSIGHLLALLASEATTLTGDQLLLTVKQVETTCTLLASIRSTCEELCPIELLEAIGEYEACMQDISLTLPQLEALEYDALGALLGVDGALVAERGETVRSSISEWRNPELLFRYLDANRQDARMHALITRWLRAIFGLSQESLRMIRRESPENIRHLLMIPQETLLRWYSEGCPGTSKCKTLFMLGEDAGSCLRIVTSEGNRYNKALLGYVLQSHVRALVVFDTVGRVMARSLIRLVIRSDTLAPVIFCDPIFFTLGYSRELQRELLRQARELQEHMGTPVVHAGSVLPLEDNGELADGFCFAADDTRTRDITFEPYVRPVAELDYGIVWVDLLEMDGVAPHTYSEEQPYDDLLQQHTPGVQTRTDEQPALVVAALPRADSISAARYVQEREGETAWTMDLGDDDLVVPDQVANQLTQRDHVSLQYKFDPNARADQEDGPEPLPANYVPPRLDG